MSSVDVIVPCYRYGRFLRECVKSVLSQSVHDLRVLIIDDESPDNTAEVAGDVVKQDPRVTFVRHSTNKGHIATYNEGIDWACADYMLILSADDYLLPGALSLSTSLMDAYPEVGFTFGRIIRMDDSGATAPTTDVKSKADFRILTGMQFIELSGASNIVATPTAVVRTALQKRLGGYRHQLPHSGDMEMWLRFATHASVGKINEYQAVYRRHCSNMSIAYLANGWLGDFHQRRAALDCFFEYYTSPSSRQLHQRLFWSLACCAIGCASSALKEGESEIADQLSSFALDVCPELRRSLRWVKFNVKRFVLSRRSARSPIIASIQDRSASVKDGDKA